MAHHMISNLLKTFDYDTKCLIKDKPIETDCKIKKKKKWVVNFKTA